MHKLTIKFNHLDNTHVSQKSEFQHKLYEIISKVQKTAKKPPSLLHFKYKPHTWVGTGQQYSSGVFVK